jgi:rubrerythrin|tara:strand:+ start:11008 stop:11151 length:144 start_codon:yes stop_codon:yes gene_type:complete
MSWFDDATWTCPICDYTLHGEEPAVHVICDNCKEGVEEVAFPFPGDC